MLDFLQLVETEVVVPSPVATEIQRRGPADVTARAIESTPWLIVVEALPIPALIQAWDLSEGEAAVLAWAHAYPGTEASLWMIWLLDGVQQL
jgi:hypothetical protein